MSVLVLGGETRSVLEVIRSLGRRGLAVDLAWAPPDSPARASRYLRSFVDLLPYGPGEQWFEALRQQLQMVSYDLVLPCTDEALLPLCARRHALPEGPVYALPSDEVLKVCGDKAATAALAASLGIPVPRGMACTAGQAPGCLDPFGLPVVVKPVSSFTLLDLGQKRKVLVAREREVAVEYLSEFEPDDPVLITEYIPGIGVGVEVLAESGEVLLSFQHRRLHEPPGGGGSSLRESEAVTPELLAWVKQICAAVGYTGVGMFEFRVGPQGAALLEVNARFWGSLPLAAAAGVDFPGALYDLLVRHQRPLAPSYPPGVRARNLILDAAWLLRGVRRDPALAFRELPGTVDPRVRIDSLAVDDVRPAVAEVQQARRKLGARVAAHWRGRRLRLQRASLVAGARDHLGPSGRVLFLCRGNICRSPFAAAMLARLGASCEVRSRGHRTRRGRRVPRQPAEIAGSFGLDLSAHRSTPLERADLRWADLVFVFDSADLAAVMRLDASCAVVPLGLLGGALWIEDPHGRARPAAQGIYETVCDALRSLVGGRDFAASDGGRVFAAESGA